MHLNLQAKNPKEFLANSVLYSIYYLVHYASALAPELLVTQDTEGKTINHTI